MLSILRLGLALLLGMAAASSAGAGAGAAATTPADAAIVTAHPALRGTLGRRLPHPVVAVTANEWQTAHSNMTAPTATTATDELRTGALEWAGQQAAAPAPPPSDQVVSAPMGSQGQSLTDQDTGILPFGGGILNEPSLDDAEPEDMAALNTTAPTPTPTYRQRRPEL